MREPHRSNPVSVRGMVSNVDQMVLSLSSSVNISIKTNLFNDRLKIPGGSSQGPVPFAGIRLCFELRQVREHLVIGQLC